MTKLEKVEPPSAKKERPARRPRPAARLAPQEASMPELTERVRSLAIELGGHLFGVAPVDRFEGAPPGHHPTDFLPDCKSVVVIASRTLDRGLEHWQIQPNGSPFLPDENVRHVMQEYWWETQSHGAASDMMSMIAYRVGLKLQDAGYGSAHIRASMQDIYGWRRAEGKIHPYSGLFSLKHAAVRAGLGEFGLNGQLITAEYGPRVRLTAVLTAAPLIPSPLITKKTCLGTKCSLCVTHCVRTGWRTHGGAGCRWRGDLAQHAYNRGQAVVSGVQRKDLLQGAVPAQLPGRYSGMTLLGRCLTSALTGQN